MSVERAHRQTEQRAKGMRGRQEPHASAEVVSQDRAAGVIFVANLARQEAQANAAHELQCGPAEQPGQPRTQATAARVPFQDEAAEQDQLEHQCGVDAG